MCFFLNCNLYYLALSSNLLSAVTWSSRLNFEPSCLHERANQRAGNGTARERAAGAHCAEPGLRPCAVQQLFACCKYSCCFSSSFSFTTGTFYFSKCSGRGYLGGKCHFECYVSPETSTGVSGLWLECQVVSRWPWLMLCMLFKVSLFIDMFDCSVSSV